ncbi:hypothetical protein AB0B39_23575 [Micromonospora sp. NPDC049114]|uniref:hypothetical protein n=1 Tax=Micromonospora sp. NPDC049114 TaxID=3155498 RepID=UPI0033EA2F87
MDHPHNLHAAANCWSLRRSWATLRDSNTAPDDDAGTIRSWRPGTGGGHGSGHGDPLGDAVTASVSRGDTQTRIAETIRDDVDSARWLATSALRHTGMPIGPALAVLTRIIGDLTPDVAGEVARYVDHADKAARRALRLGDDHWPIPSNPACPSCGVRMLRARRSAPDSATWPVICGAGCQCTGTTCGCGMTVQVRRVAHIWPAAWARDTLDLNTGDKEATNA